MSDIDTRLILPNINFVSMFSLNSIVIFKIRLSKRFWCGVRHISDIDIRLILSDTYQKVSVIFFLIYFTNISTDASYEYRHNFHQI
jgi:hypothetical protein